MLLDPGPIPDSGTVREVPAMFCLADVPSAAVQLIEIDQGQLRQHVDGLVRDAVEDTLNALLDAEADQLCGAQKYERSPDRVDYRAGSYRRRLNTKAGEVDLKVPKLRRATFESQVIERYRRRETSVEEALVEMYLAGVSVRRVEDITQALWGTRVSPSTVSELNQKIYARIHEWRNRAIAGEHPYVYLDGVWLNREFGGEVRPVAVLVAIGVNADGFREVRGGDGGGQGRHRELAGLPAAPEGARPAWCAAGDLGQVPGAGRGAGRILAGSPVAALHCGLREIHTAAHPAKMSRRSDQGVDEDDARLDEPGRVE